MADDVALNKAAIIERCVARVRDEYGGDDRNLTANLTRQDSIILAFRLLQEAGILPAELAERLMRMVGFRKVAIHDYRRLDLAIVKSIVTSRLDDFFAFTTIALRRAD